MRTAACLLPVLIGLGCTQQTAAGGLMLATSTGGEAPDDDDPDEGPDEGRDDDRDDPGSTGKGTGDGDAPIFDLGVADLQIDEGPCGCAPGTDLVYVLSSDEELWSYDPAAKQFAFVGAVDCPMFSNAMFSLAIDRRGTVFAEYRSTGDIYTMTLEDFTCLDPGYVPPGAEPMRFGLGFVRTPGPACERLLGVSWNASLSPGTAWTEGPDVGEIIELDPETMSRTSLATTDYNGGELAGTGEGRMFLFAGAPEAKLLELDADSGEVLELTPLPGVTLTEAFAMAHWGGDFHFFVESASDPSVSTVLRLDYDQSDGAGRVVSVDVAAAPIHIVGASSSTCAPTQPAG